MLAPKSRIDKVLCTEKGRMPVLQSALYDADKGKIVAADGFTIAVVPARENEGDDHSFLIPPDALKAGRGRRKADKYTITHDPDTFTVTVENGDGSAATFPEQDGKYPDWDYVMREARPDDDTEPTFSIDAKMLYDLATALCEKGSARVMVWVHSPTRALYVRPLGDNASDHEGVIMPVIGPYSR